MVREKKNRTTYNSYISLGYNYSHNRKDNIILDLSTMNIGFQGEDNNSYSFSSSGGFSMTRKLEKGRRLFAEANLGYSNVDLYTEWSTFSDNEHTVNRVYRKTPFTLNLKADSRVFLSQTNTFSVNNLNTEAGGIFSITYDNDKNRGAYLKDVDDRNSWVDSLKLRETFRYGVITINPYLKADYSYKFLKLKLDARVQFYTDKLTNKEEHQAYHLKDPAMTGSSEAEFRIAQNHFLAVGYQTNVRRPSYTQMCWYVREGMFPGQYFVGNPKLKVSRSYRNIFAYMVRFSKFSSEISSSFTCNLK